MKQEDKELLLKDLCARLPYGVKCKDQYGDYIDVNIYNAHIEHLIDQILSGVIQMVLRPMSSMTEEEREYIEDKCAFTTIGPIGGKFCLAIPVVTAEWLIDFYNSNHLDYRGLIEKGLALEAPEGMYNLNN